MNRILRILLFLLGMFAGMDALSVKIGSIEMTVFTELLMITVIIKLITNPKIYPKKDEVLTIFFCVTIVSNILSFFNVPIEWYRSNIINLLSNIVGFIGFWFLFNDRDIYASAKPFLTGFKINCVIQILWAMAQFVMCEFFHRSLNLICGFRKAREGLTLAEQVSGLGWERASLCLTMAYAIVIHNNIWVKLAAVFIAVICQSRSGLILILLVIFMSLDWKKFRRLSSTKMIKGIMVFLIIGVLVIVNFDFIFQAAVATCMRFTNLDQEASAAGHMSYYQRLPEIMKRCSPGQILFGFGGASSGYPYTKFYNRFADIEGGWSVESSWLSIIWSSGIIGFTTFMGWFLGKMRYFYKNNKNIFALIFAILIGGLGYSLLATWSEIALIFIMKTQEENKYLTNGHIGQRCKNRKYFGI